MPLFLRSGGCPVICLRNVCIFLLTPPLTAPENFHVFTINQVDTTLGMGWGGDGVGSVNVRLHLQTKLILRWGWGGVGMGWGLLTFACTCKRS